MIPNRNVLWARAIAEETVRSGVEHVCVSPGSRSSPLVLAFQEQRGACLTTHLDERGAAYFALGAAKATGRPVALVCTSGTAAANYLPGVVEAHEARVPLVVLTADRPPELQGVGANQSIDQQRLFGPYAGFFADLGVPEPQPERVRHLRALVCRAVALAVGPPAGPVHLNVPFREPLEPREVPGDVPEDWHLGDAAALGRADGSLYLWAPSHVREPRAEGIDAVSALVKEIPEGLIVCGPRAAEDGFPDAVVALSHRTGFPILADPLSGVRFGRGDDPSVLSGYDAFLGHEPTRRALRPRLFLRFGASPTSKPLLNLLRESRDARHVLVDESGHLGEETSRANTVLDADPVRVCERLVEALGRMEARRGGAWAVGLRRLEDATWNAMLPELERRPFEGSLAHHVARSLPDRSLLFVSSSLPVRDLDRFARGSGARVRVLANRGASGIDGVVSSALGAAHGLARRAVLLIGDLALLHDANGLAAAKRLGIPIDVFLANNDGGGIFEFLPIAQYEPPFTELFVTPHGTDFASLARAFGLAYERVAEPQDAARRLAAGNGSRLVEFPSERKSNVEHRRAVEERVASALADLPEVPARAD